MNKPRIWTMAIDVRGRIHNSCYDTEEHDRCRTIKVQEIIPERETYIQNELESYATLRPLYKDTKDNLTVAIKTLESIPRKLANKNVSFAAYKIINEVIGDVLAKIRS